jgi:hypothetical protein
MMRRQWQTIVFGALLSGALCAVASAQDASSSAKVKDQPRASDSAQPNAAAVPALVADAPNARLAALIRRDLTIVRNKNVMSVTRPAVGVYCILPTAASGINPQTAVVTLTPEYFYSLQTEIKVQWASHGSPCPTTKIAVYTFADPTQSGFYQFSNAVSFSIVVP